MFAIWVVYLMLLPFGWAQDCDFGTDAVNDIVPKAATGWNVSLIGSSLRSPRSILFDKTGKLLVLSRGWGIVAISMNDQGGNCVEEGERVNLIKDSTLNHGLALSNDGKKIFASSSANAFSWDYNAALGTITNKATIVKNMDNSDHNTRTLLTSKFMTNMLFVSRGSDSNLDYGSASLSSGRSQIRAFDLTKVPAGGYDFATSGLLLGRGLRNSVGIAEHTLTGGIYSVENSCDNFVRDGTDVHQNNPGEEMNFHGTLISNKYVSQGSNYGYPDCFAAWDVNNLPNHLNMKVGSAFSNSSSLDYVCTNTTAPRLTFPAHMAPLDIKFNNSGTEGWVTFHGSWDRDAPAGYKVSVIPFDPSSGQPLAAIDSSTSLIDILFNSDNGICPGNCFRPVGLAFDDKGRLYVSSDATGEIYLLVRNDRAGTNAIKSALGLSTTLKLPSTTLKLPSVSVTLPSISVKLPTTSVKLPTTSVKLPTTSIKSLTSSVKLPSTTVKPSTSINCALFGIGGINPFCLSISVSVGIAGNVRTSALPSVGAGIGIGIGGRG